MALAKTPGIGTAVALDRHAIEAEKHASVVTPGIDPVLECHQSGFGQQITQFGKDGAAESRTQESRIEIRRPLEGLERDIP